MDLPFDISGFSKGLIGVGSVLPTFVAIVVSTRVVLPVLFKVIGLPPLVVLQRRVRPYLHYALYIGLAIYRIIIVIRSASDNGQEGRIMPSAKIPLSIDMTQHGLLDALIQLLHNIRGNMSAELSHMPDSSPSLARVLNILLRFCGIIINDILGIIFLRSTLCALYTIRHASLSELKSSFIQSAYEFAADNIPAVKKELAKEEIKMMKSIEAELKDPKRIITSSLPTEKSEHLITNLEKRAKVENEKWQQGKVSGTVYSGEQEHTELLNKVYAFYAWANPLHADIWPSVSQCEAEVISMTANLVNGGDSSVVGLTSSGGTESIVLAMRSAKEAFGRKRGIDRPEIIASSTAHAGLDKACDMFGIRLVQLEADPVTFQLRPKDVVRAMTKNTILIYSSAPNFPQGVIDPIEKLSELAVRYDIGLHVDACLGGFVLPFAKKLGYELPAFDFGCRGVTSMSCDTHKYGYASKGTSVVLFRNKELRRCAYFAYPKWTGGLYATPTIAGSRSGALLACAWASMVSLGEQGYLTRVGKIMNTTHRIAAQVASIEGLYLLGGMPKAMIVCFGSTEFNIYRVGDAMSKRGWSLNTLQRPACLHLCVTLATIPHEDKFIDELKSVVDEVRKEGNAGNEEGNAAIYGLAGSLPPGPVATLLKCYTDAVLTP